MTPVSGNALPACRIRLLQWLRAVPWGMLALALLLLYFVAMPRHVPDQLLGLRIADTDAAAAVGVLFLIWAMLRYRELWAALRSGWPLPALALFCLLANPSAPGLVFLAETLLAMLIALQYAPRQKLAFCALVLGGLTLANWAAAACLPEIGLTYGGGAEEIKHAGTWRGIFWHKNQLGSAAGLGCVFFLYALAVWRQAACALLLGISALLLWHSHSVVSLVAAALATGLLGVLLRKGMPPVLKAACIAAGVLVPAAVIFLMFSPQVPGFVPAWLVKDPTMTQRWPLWQETLRYALGHGRTVLGYGLSFWDGAGGAAVTRQLGFNPYDATNGFIDAFVVGGYSGLVLVLFALLRDFVRAGRAVFSPPRDMAPDESRLEGWFVLFLGYLAIENLGGSHLLRQNELLWMLWVALSFGRPPRRV